MNYYIETLSLSCFLMSATNSLIFLFFQFSILSLEERIQKEYGGFVDLNTGKGYIFNLYRDKILKRNVLICMAVIPFLVSIFGILILKK